MIDPRQARQPLTGNYEMTKALTHYAGLTTEAERTVYRNRVAYVWLAASDAEYFNWTQDLSREMKGTGLGASWAVLLMNGIAVVSGAEAARALAVGSATVVGGSAALKKEVFQEQSLTAATMRAEAQRSRESTNIRRRLNQANSTEYPLGEALIDIAQLNKHANLNRAVGDITADAAADLKAAEAEASQLIKIPLVTPDVQSVREAFSAYVLTEKDETKLQELRKFLDAAPDPEQRIDRQNIMDAYAMKAKDKESVNARTDKLKEITGKEFKL